MSSFQTDLTNSAADFLGIVWPAIQKDLGGGELIPVESIADKGMATLLDQRSGIDAWHLSQNHQIRGIASRIQWAEEPWNTFTVRYSRDSGAETEYGKRKRDIAADKGWLYPHLTIQAYINEGKLLSAAVVQTTALITACDLIVSGQMPPKNGGIRRTGNATFLWCRWAWFQKNGLAIKIINA